MSYCTCTVTEHLRRTRRCAKRFAYFPYITPSIFTATGEVGTLVILMSLTDCKLRHQEVK